MKKYNLVITENKHCIPFLNLTEQAFYNKLWEWTPEYDLWDYIDEVKPSKEDLESVLYQFINESVFHKYGDDEINCFAFILNNDSIEEYQIEKELLEFIQGKIKEFYND